MEEAGNRTSSYDAVPDHSEAIQSKSEVGLLGHHGADMGKIYVVYGQTGEYDDYAEWAVKAYKSKRKAEAHAKKANERAKPWDYYADNKISFNEFMGDLDPCGRADYTGTEYWVSWLPYDEG